MCCEWCYSKIKHWNLYVCSINGEPVDFCSAECRKAFKDKIARYEAYDKLISSDDYKYSSPELQGLARALILDEYNLVECP